MSDTDRTTTHDADGTETTTAPRFAIVDSSESLPDDARGAVRWLDQYIRTKRLTVADAAAQLTKRNGESYSPDSLSAIISGKWGGKYDQPVEAINRLRRRVEESSPRTSAQTGFIETSTTRAVWNRLDRVRRQQALTFIYGPSQTGKTAAVSEYAVRHPGNTILVRMPTRGNMFEFIAEMSLLFGIPSHDKFANIRRRIIESFSPDTLLVIDEAQQCCFNTRGITTLEFIREIHDRRKCPVTLVGSDVFFRSVTVGSQSHILRQLLLRCTIPPLAVPAIPSRETLARFASNFGLATPAADGESATQITITDEDGRSIRIKPVGNPLETQTRIIRDYGLGRWLSILAEAKEQAAQSRATPTWARVLHVVEQYRQMEG